MCCISVNHVLVHYVYNLRHDICMICLMYNGVLSVNSMLIITVISIRKINGASLKRICHDYRTIAVTSFPLKNVYDFISVLKSSLSNAFTCSVDRESLKIQLFSCSAGYYSRQ